MKELAEMEKINAQLSAAVEEVTRAHREKAEVSLAFCYSVCLLLQASFLLSELCAEISVFWNYCHVKYTHPKISEDMTVIIYIFSLAVRKEILM